MYEQAKGENAQEEKKRKKDEVEVFWQDANRIPYDQMRTADADFLPLVLEGKTLKKRYFYANDGSLTKIEQIVD